MYLKGYLKDPTSPSVWLCPGMNLCEGPTAPALPSDPCATGMHRGIQALERHPAQNATPTAPPGLASTATRPPHLLPQACPRGLVCFWATCSPCALGGLAPLSSTSPLGRDGPYLPVPPRRSHQFSHCTGKPTGLLLPNCRGLTSLSLSPSWAWGHGDGAQLTGHERWWAWRQQGSRNQKQFPSQSGARRLTSQCQL